MSMSMVSSAHSRAACYLPCQLQLQARKPVTSSWVSGDAFRTHSWIVIGPVATAATALAALATALRSASALQRQRCCRPAAQRAPRSVSRKSQADDRYQGKDYWDKRYQAEVGDTYDWLGDYDKFKEFIDKATSSLADGAKSARILDLGCGNARLAEEMYDRGFEHITALDISDVVIESMQARNAETRPGINWVVGDAFGLPFEDSTFDLVIDKSTTDAVSCETDTLHQNMTRMYGEVFRVLKDSGTFLVFSAVGDVTRKALQLPHLAFDVDEKELFLCFASLTAFSAAKRLEPPAALPFAEALRFAEQVDKRMAEERRAREVAEMRLRDAAPSSFSVLD